MGELSLSAPLTAFSPVFLLGIAPFITGDAPTVNGIIGSCLVVLGSYLLNLSQTKLGFWAPIRALVSNPAPRLMLILAFMWSITGSIDRAALKEFELLFWGPAQMLAITVVYLPFAIFCRRGLAGDNPLRQGRAVLTIGGFNALSYLTYLFALTLAPVYFVVCVKRSSILFSIFLGKHLFNEGNSAERLLGASLMIAGIAVICVP
jgi:drug/metabolite transporter (DMT)-like permease